MIKKFRTALQVIKLIKNYPIYFADYFKLLKNKEIIFKFRNEVKFKVRAGSTDRFVINEIWLHNSYTPKGFEIKENDVVVDIGGHIGVFSIFASKCAKKGKVYVFEPVPENFDLLEKNKELNDCKNLKTIRKAVANRKKKKVIHVSMSENKGNNSFFKISDNSKEIEIETELLSDFVRKNKIKKIDFLKMDCEGAEYNILYNCSKDMLKKIRKISMEYHDLDEKRNGMILKKFLEKNGFETFIKTEPRKGRILARSAK